MSKLKAEQKEIKLGDWVISRQRVIVEAEPAVMKHKSLWIKLPQSIQDGLNEFMKNKRKYKNPRDLKK